MWANEFDDAQKVSFKYKRQNKKKIIQCLVCNVNLCTRCDHTFHGVEMASSDVLYNSPLITKDELCFFTNTTSEHTEIPWCAPFMCPELFSRWEYSISRRFAERISSGTCHVRTLQRNF